MSFQINAASVAGAFGSSRRKQVCFDASKQKVLYGDYAITKGQMDYSKPTYSPSRQYAPGSWAEQSAQQPSPFAADGSSASGRL